MSHAESLAEPYYLGWIEEFLARVAKVFQGSPRYSFDHPSAGCRRTARSALNAEEKRGLGVSSHLTLDKVFNLKELQ